MRPVPGSRTIRRRWSGGTRTRARPCSTTGSSVPPAENTSRSDRTTARLARGWSSSLRMIGSVSASIVTPLGGDEVDHAIEVEFVDHDERAHRRHRRQQQRIAIGTAGRQCARAPRRAAVMRALARHRGGMRQQRAFAMHGKLRRRRRAGGRVRDHAQVLAGVGSGRSLAHDIELGQANAPDTRSGSPGRRRSGPTIDDPFEARSSPIGRQRL